MHGGIDAAIEALILYDELAFDGPSVKRNADKFPSILELTRRGELLGEADETLENDIYSSVIQIYVPRLTAMSPECENLFRMHTEPWMAAEIGAAHYYPSSRWLDIESELTGEAATLAQSLHNQFSQYTPFSGAACAMLIRTLYYDRLQQFANADLMLHPLKGAFLGGVNTDRPKYNAWDSTTILDIFDEEVRHAYYEARQNGWDMLIPPSRFLCSPVTY